ncbi:MAG: hypothetical protein NTW49_10185 [Bacteroidia bacterium]|nr:hypothetical protein [Bacteroidia bacterium]
MLNTLKSNQNLVLILIPLFIVILWLQSFIHPSGTVLLFADRAMPLYKLVLGIAGNKPVTLLIIALFLFVIQVLQVIKLNKDFILIDIRTYTPAVVFTLACCSYPAMRQLQPVLFANIFILLSLSKIFQTYKDESLFTNFFDASFFISLASLFYFNALFMLLVVWSGMVILRQFSIREWLLSLSGLILPYVFVLVFYYIYDKVPHLLNMLSENLKNSGPGKGFSLPVLLFFSYMGFLVLLASIGIIKKYDKMKIGIRKFYKIFFWMFVYSLILFFAVPGASAGVLLITAIPVSYILTDYLINIKKEPALNFIIWLLLAMVIYLQVST